MAALTLTLRAADAPPAAEAADGQPVNSKITAVTVFADRAQVTRVGDVNLGAEGGRFVFGKLPGWLDEGSVRVAIAPVEAGQILDVEIRRSFLARASDEEVQKAENALRELTDQIGALDDEKNVLEAEAKQVEAIRAFSLEKLPKDMAAREVKPAEYGQTVEYVVETLRKIATAKRALEKKRRDLQPEQNARQRKVEELRARAQLEQRNVVVTIKGAAKTATLTLSYLLPGATWEPVHELRAGVRGGPVTLASFAVVQQTTGEDWSDVKLSLSTQKSTATMKIPELEALTVGGRRLPKLFASSTDTFLDANKNWDAQNTIWNDFINPSAVEQQEFRRNRALAVDNIKRVERVFESLQQRGTSAHFAGQGSQIIRSDGRPVRVPIGQAELAAQQRIIAVPEMSLNAARTADLTNHTAQSFLPGRVSIFLGGAFVGLTENEYVAPGEGFALYLGVADQVKLARTLDKKRSSLSWSGSKTRMLASYVVTVENLTDQAQSIHLSERIPISEMEEIRVYGVKVQPDTKPDAKGLLHWDIALGARQSKDYRVEYSIEYPTDLLERLQKQQTGGGKSQGVPAPSIQLRQQIEVLEKQLK
jgi:uncharacterized protein (TIGR02231 family)